MCNTGDSSPVAVVDGLSTDRLSAGREETPWCHGKGMTDIDPRLDHDRALTHDSELEQVLALLLERAMNPRQLWLFFLDGDDRMVGPVMPCDDYPDDPDDRGPSEFGVCGFAAVLARRLGEILEMVDGSQVVLVWERPGPPKFAADELSWARAMARECGELGVPVRAQFLLHTNGTRLLTPDDYAA